MRQSIARLLSGIGVATLALGAGAVTAPEASAAPANAVSFACFNTPGPSCPSASFHGYATGSELHLSALDAQNTTVANLDQAFSGASTASAGLTTAIRSETTSIVQPAQTSATKAYGTGAGLEIGLGTDDLSTTDQHQIQVAGRAQQVAPPNGPTVTANIPINASPLISASLLTGVGAAVYDSSVCPIGQPISYGAGDAAGAQALLVSTPPLLSLSGTGTSVARSNSMTYLSNNGNGSFGLSTTASDDIAPVSANLPGGFAVQVAVQTAGGVNDPVALTAITTGGSTGAAVKFSTDDLLKVNLITPASTTPTNLITVPLSAIGPSGLHIPLSTSTLGSTLTGVTGALSGVVATIPGVGPTLSGVLSSQTGLLQTIGATASQVIDQVAVINLGSIDVDTTPHAIGGLASSPATVVGGTTAAGALDLLHLQLGVSGTIGGQPIPSINVADFYAGHLETSAHLTNPIVCSIPVIKTANPPNVTAGNQFVYNIQVPDPAKLDLIDCNLDNVTVTDTIKDLTGDPAFTVVSATDTQNGAAGQIQTVSDHEAVVTWTGLSYKVAPTGQPPNAPIPLAITVSTPASSPAGVITDTVFVQAAAGSCQGGVSGQENLGGANGAALTGTFTLNQPSVAAAAAAAAPAAAAKAKTLPFTGAMGGLWQPVGGLAALGAGAGALILVRRARRLAQK